MTTLQGKTALITGGTSGIGLATAKLFIEKGAIVTVTGRNPETLEAARAELGDGATVVASDAGNPADITELFAGIAKRHDKLDVLFLNAGIAKFVPIAESGESLIDDIFRINFKGPYLALQAALPLLRPGSSVLINTSVVDRKGLPGASVYAASKAALRSLVRTAAAELAASGVRINAISPGPIETPIYGKLGWPAEQVSGFAESVVQSIPLGRFGTADELAQGALFLASDASKFVHGTELEIDGGFAQV